MATITLSLIGYDCCYFESEIRNAIWEMTGEEGVEIEVQNDWVVVTGCNASAQELIEKIYHKPGMLAVEGKEEEDDEEEDEEEEDDKEEDDDEDKDDDKEEDNKEKEEGDGEDGESEVDDNTYVQMSSLSLNPITAIPEPWWEDQPVAGRPPVPPIYFLK